MLNYARLCYNYANYALCSDCVIMPKSNAGIIGLPQNPGGPTLVGGGERHYLLGGASRRLGASLDHRGPAEAPWRQVVLYWCL